MTDAPLLKLKNAFIGRLDGLIEAKITECQNGYSQKEKKRNKNLPDHKLQLCLIELS